MDLISIIYHLVAYDLKANKRSSKYSRLFSSSITIPLHYSLWSPSPLSTLIYTVSLISIIVSRIQSTIDIYPRSLPLFIVRIYKYPPYIIPLYYSLSKLSSAIVLILISSIIRLSKTILYHLLYHTLSSSCYSPLYTHFLPLLSPDMMLIAITISNSFSILIFIFIFIFILNIYSKYQYKYWY